MKATLHSHNFFATKIAENKLSLVTLYCGYGEIGNFGVGDSLFYFYFVGKCAESCAENDSDLGVKIDGLSYEVDSLFYFRQHV